MSVLLDGAGAWTIQRKRTVAIHAQLVRWLSQLSIIVGAMDIVAAKARHSSPVHYTLNKIVSLHAVFVSRAVGKVREGGLAQRVFLKLPKIPQIRADMVPNRPVIILAFDGNRHRTPLRVALNAGIAGGDIIHSRRIQNVSARGMLHMLAARSVALFATNVPFRYPLGLDVVINRVASIAGSHPAGRCILSGG